MSERLKSLQRILKVREQMVRAAEWRLVAGERQALEAEAERKELDAFVDAGHASGALASHALRQTQRLAVRQKRLAAERDALAARTVEAKRQHKQAETVVHEAARVERAIRERRDLEELIDAMLARGTAE